jgi:mono/diheme cytochrome c family protein
MKRWLFMALALLGCKREPWALPASQRCEESFEEGARRVFREEGERREAQFQQAILRPNRELVRNGHLLEGTLDRFVSEGQQLFVEDAPWRDGPSPSVNPLRLGRLGADATRCAGCHHKGGLGGSGSRADLTFFDARGDDTSTARERLPRMLAGAALLELAARDEAGRVAFGWARGRPQTLREMVAFSARTHLAERATDAEIDALTAWIASIPTPIESDPPSQSLTERARRGARLFERFRCGACHSPSLAVQRSTLSLSEGRSLDLRMRLSHDGRPPYRVHAFTDLREHDMGAALADRDGRRTWVSAPLWGVASRGPYLHDGRATTVLAAIRMHDGEARPSREAFEAHPEGPTDLLAYLQSLDRAPCMQGSP